MLARFAPSPTGRMHVGNARAALINFLLVRGDSDRFLLRLDDTDPERSREDYARSIEEDLNWLGLHWGRKVRQSDRLDLYRAAAQKLTASGRLYPCYETAEELEFQRRRQRAKGLPPVYDRRALRLNEAEKKAFEDENRRPHWRFHLDPGLLEWDDLVRGRCRYDSAHVSDPVVIREDGTFLYMLPSVVDDVDLGVTHVVRGEDHVTNTAIQIQMFRALGAEPPAFAHLPLLVDAEGKGFSKRLGSLSIADLRAQGIEPMTVNSLLARLGTALPIDPVSSMAALIKDFRIEACSKGSPKFDPADLRRLNQRILLAAPWPDIAERLKELGCGETPDEAFWQAIAPNLSVLSEAPDWHRIVYGPMRPAEDTVFLAQARALLPPEPWDETTWPIWTNALKAATGAKGKDLFHPLRVALTGREDGPELKRLLPLIGRDRALERLGGQ